MKKIKSFLCIDDDPQLSSVCASIGLRAPVKLTLQAPPNAWEKAIDEITAKLTSRKFDGLLLDFRLDEYPETVNGVKVRYTAESLVNELRRRSVEDGNGDNSYPIILWSTANNLSGYFSINPSYTALYDGIWDKEVVRNNALEYGLKLASLASGYQSLHLAAKKNLPLHSVLNCAATSVLIEMEQAFVSKIKKAPYAFNYATFVINRILRFNGVLIDLETIAAILGINAPGKIELIINKLSTPGKEIIYTGVFSSGNKRFWREPLLAALNQLSGEHWVHLKADLRAEILSKKFRLKNLTAAQSIHASYQTDFDCVCAYSRKPLARRNGYRIHPSTQDPWIQPSYVAGTVYRMIPTSDVRRPQLDVGEQERFKSDFSSKP